MAARTRTTLFAAALAVATTALYATRLDYSPAFVMHDELKFALQAESIASTGRDLTGRLMPVFFTEPEFPAGRDPVIIYTTALALTVLPLSEMSARLPTALVGVVDVVLMFLVARRLLGHSALALVTAGFLALTPAHFIRSRLVLSPLYAMPFVLAWLLSAVPLSDRPSDKRLAAAAAWLGLGVYTYLASVVMMPVYLLLTIGLAYRALGRRAAVIAIAAFAIPLVPMAFWYLTHPERSGQLLDAYRLHESGGGTAAWDPAARIAWFRKGLGLFWSFFSPSFLFLTGDSSLINSTRQSGFFPLSFAVLMPVGIYRLATGQRGMATVIVAGLATAPLASIVTGEVEMNRTLFAIPFGVLAAGYGMDALLRSPSPAWRAIAVVLVVAVPLQFAVFYQDYMGRYRIDASPWFGGNTRGALTVAIERAGTDPQHRVYVSDTIPFADRYWRFYALANRRPDLIDKLVRYGSEAPADALPGSDLVCRLSAPECEALDGGDGGWQLVRRMSELDGTPAFALFEKRGR